ncbi:MAG: FapA family protein [Gemmatimonadota bacterium]
MARRKKPHAAKEQPPPGRGQPGPRPAPAVRLTPAAPEIACQLPPGLQSVPDLAEMRALLGAATREQLQASLAGVHGWAVKPGDVLARPIRRGHVTDRGALAHLELLAGPGVDLSGDGTCFTATRWGYAGLVRGQLQVQAPLWVCSDGMEACCLSLPLVDGASALTPEGLLEALAEAGVTCGIDREAAAAIRPPEGSEPGTAAVLPVARGQWPVRARDAEVSFAFRYQAAAGAIRPDGSIDFKERDVFPPVREGSLLAACRPAVPGQVGHTVRGAQIPVPAPAHAELVPGDNVRLEQREGVQEVYAQIDGGAIVRTEEVEVDGEPVVHHIIAVQPVAQFKGDVDYETGNIDVNGNVLIGGSVTAGFSVSAGGDIAITGSVDAGAHVTAGGSVTVQQGIAGESTRVEAGGSVTARFIQDAHVDAGGDVVIGSYAHRADICTLGRLHIEGAGGGGGAAGGRVWALLGITASSVGARGSGTTELLVGPQREGHTKLSALRQTMARVDAALAKLLPALGVTDATGLPALLTQGLDEPTRRRARQAQQLARARVRCADQESRLAAALERPADDLTVDVAGSAYAGTTVRIGESHLELDQDLRAVRFCLESEGRPHLVARQLGT